MLEAKAFKAWASLEGIPVDITIRAYVEDDKVLAIRSVHVTDANGKPYPTTNDGKMTRADIEALVSPSPRQLRDTANRPWEEK